MDLMSSLVDVHQSGSGCYNESDHLVDSVSERSIIGEFLKNSFCSPGDVERLLVAATAAASFTSSMAASGHNSPMSIVATATASAVASPSNLEHSGGVTTSVASSAAAAALAGILQMRQLENSQLTGKKNAGSPPLSVRFLPSGDLHHAASPEQSAVHDRSDLSELAKEERSVVGKFVQNSFCGRGDSVADLEVSAAVAASSSTSPQPATLALDDAVGRPSGALSLSSSAERPDPQQLRSKASSSDVSTRSNSEDLRRIPTAPPSPAERRKLASSSIPGAKVVSSPEVSGVSDKSDLSDSNREQSLKKHAEDNSIDNAGALVAETAIVSKSDEERPRKKSVTVVSIDVPADGKLAAAAQKPAADASFRKNNISSSNTNAGSKKIASSAFGASVKPTKAVRQPSFLTVAAPSARRNNSNNDVNAAASRSSRKSDAGEEPAATAVQADVAKAPEQRITMPLVRPGSATSLRPGSRFPSFSASARGGARRPTDPPTATGGEVSRSASSSMRASRRPPSGSSTRFGFNKVIHTKLETIRRLNGSAVKIQRWWRLKISEIRYAQQLKRLRTTQAARVIQYAWLRYTFRISNRIIPDFSRWAVLYRRRLLHRMSVLLRRELLRRRHAAIVLIRSLRWFVMRPLRARQLKERRAASMIQKWYRDIGTKISRRSKLTRLVDHIADTIKEERHVRAILAAEQHLFFVQIRVLHSEHRQLTRLGDHDEAWRLFRRRGGYDERIGRTQQRIVTAEEVARSNMVEDELAARDCLRVERLFQRQRQEKVAQQAAAILLAASPHTRPQSAGTTCCGVNAFTPLRSQLSSCSRTGIVPAAHVPIVSSPSSSVLHFSLPSTSRIGVSFLAPSPPSRGSASADAASVGADQIAAFQRTFTPRKVLYTSISSLL